MRKSKEEIRSEQQRELSLGMKRLLTGYRTLLESGLEQEGVTLAQLRMLHALNERAETSAAELARSCYITPQSMQAVVTRAEREGWITRSAADGNRRVLKATLTASGRKLLERGAALAAGIEGQIWRGVKLSELRAFNLTLNQALQRLQESQETRHRDAKAGARRTGSAVTDGKTA